MKTLYLHIIIFILSVIFLLFFLKQDFFIPISQSGEIIYVNIQILLALLFFILESFLFIILFGLSKVFIYKKNEILPIFDILKWSIAIPSCAILILIFNIYHILSLPWAISIVVIVIIGIILFR